MQRVSIEHERRTGTSATARQRLSPAAIHGLEVLSLPVATLETYVYDAVEHNPLLDLDYSDSSIEFSDISDYEDDGACDTFSDIDGPADGWPDEARPYSSGLSAGREAYDFGQVGSSVDEISTLQSYLRLQAARLVFADNDEVRLRDAVIAAVDDDGYLTESLPVLCSRVGCSVAQGEKVLSAVQTLDPPGVAARDLTECLLLQLDSDEPFHEVLVEMLSSGMQDLACNRTTQLMRRFALSRERLSLLQERIRALDPRPGASFSQRDAATFIIPDLSILKLDNRFVVDVTGEIGETLTLNGEYLSMLKDGMHDVEAQAWLESHRTEADQVIRNISERRKTLYRLGRFLLESQYDFFCYGENRLKPLTMQHAAEILDLHVSTISRAVQDKHVLTPWGVYPARFFFCNPIPCERAGFHGTVSSLAIKNRIKDIVAQEDPHDPLSDAAVMGVLNGEGIDIKRRTIAKYREALGVERQSQRRR